MFCTFSQLELELNRCSQFAEFFCSAIRFLISVFCFHFPFMHRLYWSGIRRTYGYFRFLVDIFIFLRRFTSSSSSSLLQRPFKISRFRWWLIFHFWCLLMSVIIVCNICVDEESLVQQTSPIYNLLFINIKTMHELRVIKCLITDCPYLRIYSVFGWLCSKKVLVL